MNEVTCAVISRKPAAHSIHAVESMQFGSSCSVHAVTGTVQLQPAARL